MCESSSPRICSWASRSPEHPPFRTTPNEKPTWCTIEPGLLGAGFLFDAKNAICIGLLWVKRGYIIPKLDSSCSYIFIVFFIVKLDLCENLTASSGCSGPPRVRLLNQRFLNHPPQHPLWCIGGDSWESCQSREWSEIHYVVSFFWGGELGGCACWHLSNW